MKKQIEGNKINFEKFQFSERRYQEVIHSKWDDSKLANKNLTKEQKEHIIELRKQGHTLKRIGNIYGISDSSVLYITKDKI